MKTALLISALVLIIAISIQYAYADDDYNNYNQRMIELQEEQNYQQRKNMRQQNLYNQDALRLQQQQFNFEQSQQFSRPYQPYQTPNRARYYQ